MYIDSSAGSLLLQILAAGLISGLAMITRVREVVRSFFRGVKERHRRT